jgi:UDPglucose 6-dehydrogenase
LFLLQVISFNEYQKTRFIARIIKALFNTATGKRIAILGFAFKKDTGDTRETAALTVVDRLLDEGAILSVYDPVVEPSTINRDLEQVLGRHRDSLQVCKSAYEAALGAHAIVICTEWDEFRFLDYARIYQSMTKPAFIFDGRLILDPDSLRAIGFSVHSIGRANVSPHLSGPSCCYSGLSSPDPAELAN